MYYSGGARIVYFYSGNIYKGSGGSYYGFSFRPVSEYPYHNHLKAPFGELFRK